MRKISAWARDHRSMARLLVVLIKIILAVMAWLTGSLLSGMGITIPESIGFFALFILITAALLYPSRDRKSSSKKFHYLHQKSCDFIMALCTFTIMTSFTNNQLYQVSSTFSYASNITLSKTPTAEEIIASLQYRDKKSLTRQEKKILRKEFKKQLRIYTKATLSGNKKEADQAALILLVILGAIGLAILLSALVCSISCGGAEGLAAAVAIVGLIAIVWLSVVLIKRINNGPRNKSKNWSKTG